MRRHLQSDVPVGVLLSGGIDSSSIASAVRSIVGPDGELHLFSAVSNDPRFDESPFITRVSSHVGSLPRKVVLDFEPDRAFGLL